MHGYITTGQKLKLSLSLSLSHTHAHTKYKRIIIFNVLMYRVFIIFQTIKANSKLVGSLLSGFIYSYFLENVLCWV